jgi:uncharacterized protein YchJ
MSKTRDNHFVPQWYQKGFSEDREDQLCHLKTKTINLPNGEVKEVTSMKWYSPAQCFYKTDLYTTLFGTHINDEIEKKLFGYIDDNGSEAVRAFLTDDQVEWQKNFQNFFVYLDAQKIRTPKGLDWIKSKYHTLEQNELMLEMQAIRLLHCTLWAEGVREFVSADESEIKFIVSDHPITIYNYACPPESKQCSYPNDPDIALKGSQTIFPLDKNRCLILTNLEYAQDPCGIDPLELRTNPTKVRQSMVNTIEFINIRKLTAEDVTKINYIIKSRAHVGIGGGKKEWLYPEISINCDWADLKHVLLPPSKEQYRFGGEMFVGYEDGSTHYQDAFGRSTSQHNYLDKDIDESKLGRNDFCGCGSGKKYKQCCQGVSNEHRTTWKVRSIRERNLRLYDAIFVILGFDSGNTWDDVRRDISEEQIAKIYGIYGALWPIETNIYSLLPKSDGKFRGLYTGPLDPRTIGAYALGVTPYFDELLIQHPFINPNNVKPEFSPVKSPSKYKYQALKDISFLLSLEPLVASGLVNLIPDPCCFDYHLHRQMLEMAKNRGKKEVISVKDRDLHFRLTTEDLLNSTYMMPREVKTRMLLKEFSHMTQQDVEAIQDGMEVKSKIDPLVLLQEMKPGDDGQFISFSLAPNYEMTLFIAQATGSVVVTDSESRWNELQRAQHRDQGVATYPWNHILKSGFELPIDYDVIDTLKRSSTAEVNEIRQILRSINVLVKLNDQDGNQYELLSQKLTSLCERVRGKAVNQDVHMAGVRILAPDGGFMDTNVHRLLLKSNCQQYSDKVDIVIHIGNIVGLST